MYFFAFGNLAIGAVALFSPDSGAQSADGVPLFSFPQAAADAIVGAVALLGVAGFLMGVLYSIAATRYRSMIPLMYLFIVGSYAARRAIGAFKPIPHEGAHAGGAVIIAMTVLAVAGLLLSVVGKGYAAGAEPTPVH